MLNSQMVISSAMVIQRIYDGTWGSFKPSKMVINRYLSWGCTLIKHGPLRKANLMMDLPSGKPTKNYGKIHLMFNGKLTIYMAIFNSYVTNYQRVIL